MIGSGVIHSLKQKRLSPLEWIVVVLTVVAVALSLFVHDTRQTVKTLEFIACGQPTTQLPVAQVKRLRKLCHIPKPKTGPTGKAGATGSAGPTGSTGPKGKNGRDGTDGLNGKAGSDGADGSTGPPGPAGPKGPKGDKGDQGPRGRTGSKGPKGDPGPVSAGTAQLIQTLQNQVNTLEGRLDNLIAGVCRITPTLPIC